jgi:type IV secretory pathway VirD2 relaxase
MASRARGLPASLSSDRTDRKAFAERGEGDRHQFRFIVAAEDSAELADLKPFVRGLMRAGGNRSWHEDGLGRGGSLQYRSSA